MPIPLSALPCTTLVNSTPQRAPRSIAHTARAAKALPFSLQSHQRNDQWYQVVTDGNRRTCPGSDHEAKVLRMVMFGKPSSGKGTLSLRLVKKYDVLSLSTGDLLRQHIAERTAVGQQAEGIVAQGGLVPDEIMLQVAAGRLDALHNRHWILDGFPRTLNQGKLLDAHLQISDRWVHLPSGRIYNMSYNRPKVDGLDDETGEPLAKRPDDNPVGVHDGVEVFAHRLKQFHDSTSPLISYYASKPESAWMVTLHGKTSNEIWPKLEAVVRSSFPNLRERAAARRHSLSDTFMTGEDAWYNTDLSECPNPEAQPIVTTWLAVFRLGLKVMENVKGILEV
ncbi:ADK-domain-containing protein [Pisolithus sp. B1]|nr:ADK-domain-containing protein [Pisolithus sp. B1]